MVTLVTEPIKQASIILPSHCLKAQSGDFIDLGKGSGKFGGGVIIDAPFKRRQNVATGEAFDAFVTL